MESENYDYSEASLGKGSNQTSVFPSFQIKRFSNPQNPPNSSPKRKNKTQMNKSSSRKMIKAPIPPKEEKFIQFYSTSNGNLNGMIFILVSCSSWRRRNQGNRFLF